MPEVTFGEGNSVIDNHFRPHLPRVTRTLIRLYRFIGITPNQITLLSLTLSLIAAYLVATHSFVPAIALWWVGRLFDGTDGIYARESGQATQFGAFLDILCDMASYSIMIVGFSFVFPEMQSTWIVILFLYVLCITGALALGSFEGKNPEQKKDNRGLRLAAGIAEGGETGIAYSAFLLFPAQIHILAIVWIAILFVTVIARTVLAREEL